MLVTSTGAFFWIQWEEYHTHVLRTSTGIFGTTEVQICTAAPIVLNVWMNRFLSWGTFADLGLAPYLPEVLHD